MPCSALYAWACSRIESTSASSIGAVGAAGIEKADEHLVSPYFFRSVRSERNSRRRSGFFRNEPRMMLFVIFESMSFTPRHCMQ